jgi:uncharacterized lipoprotein YajG
VRKYFFGFLVGMGLVFFAGFVRSQEPTVPLTLEVPAQFFMNLCPDRPFQGVKVYWKGVEDQRSVKILGVVSKKEGKDAVQVISEPPLEKIFQNYLNSLLEQCGMQLVQRPQDALYQMQATIQEFHAEEEKGWVTGKGEAKSRLEFTAASPERKITANVGYGVEFKQGRKRGIVRLQKILNELLQETLRQVPGSVQLRSMKS